MRHSDCKLLYNNIITFSDFFADLLNSVHRFANLLAVCFLDNKAIIFLQVLLSV